MKNNENNQSVECGPIDCLKNYEFWCGFSEDKHPFGLDRIKGISVNTPRDRIGRYEQAKALGYPYCGISFTDLIKIGNQILVCIDLD